jgi:D-arabinose 1-dehydrogenase-like Zn-dependent alcohol dehydrogenase
MLRGIRVVGCFVGNRQDAVEALQLHASGQVSTDSDTLYRPTSNM